MMGRKNIAKLLFSAILIDVIIGFLFLNSRLFSHLAIWNIMESSKESSFYWSPENAPGYFYFEPDSGDITAFKNEISPLIKNEKDDFKIMIEIAKYVMDVSSPRRQMKLSLKWDSPRGMLKQVKDGAGANCFHRAILFSTYLTSIGMKSRLWALENKSFELRAHTVNEVYIESLKKWVFIDTMFGFYAAEGAGGLSFLEFRENLLDGGTNRILLHDIRDENRRREALLNYKRLVRCAFLRSGNDFNSQYSLRYGFLNVFRNPIDKLPDNIRRGLDYLFGRKDIFIHYVDKYSFRLKPKIIIAKLLFYFFILSPFFSLILAISRSKKDTRHK